MSKMVTLRTPLTHRYNKSVILGGLEVKFDQFGMTDVMERHAKELIEAGLEAVDKEDVEKYAKIRKEMAENAQNEVPAIDFKDENDNLKKQVAKLTEENKILKEQLEAATKKESKEDSGDQDFEAMSVKDLKELCESVKLPKEEWNNLTKKDLIVYIKAKLNE